ncbi:cytochrome P450 [Nannocystaceae bacterium ST9]
MPPLDSLPRLPALPLIGNAFGIMRDPIEFQRRGHERHGPIFGARVFGVPLTFVDPVGAPELLEKVVRAPREQLSMVEAYKLLVGRILGTELFTELDKTMQEGLSARHVMHHVGPTLAFVPELLARRLPADAGTLDGFRFANDVVLHAIAHYVLGREAADLHADELAAAMHVLESDFSVLGMMLPLETASARRRSAALEQMIARCEAEVRRRLAADALADDDFLDFVLARREPGEVDLRALALRALGVMFGAHTNTAMTVSSVLSDLVEHPDDLARVREELDGLPRDAALAPADFKSLVHLHRAINESLRLRSNGGIWRKALCEFELDRHVLPAGTLIGASMGLVHLDRARYDSPHAFRPERYAALTTDSFQSPSVVSTPLQFGAFGTGRGLCSGRPLAYAMLAGLLVPLLRDYEWTVDARPRRWFTVMTGGLARPVGPLTLRYRRAR